MERLYSEAFFNEPALRILMTLSISNNPSTTELHRTTLLLIQTGSEKLP